MAGMEKYKRREPKGATIQTAFRLDEGIYKRLCDIAKERRLSMSRIGQEAIEAWLKKYGKKGEK